MRRRVTVHTRHQLKQASNHHKQKRASLVATEAIVVENPRTIVVVLKGTVGAPQVMAGARCPLGPQVGPPSHVYMLGPLVAKEADEGRAPDDGGGGPLEIGAATQDVGHDRVLATRNPSSTAPGQPGRPVPEKEACEAALGQSRVASEAAAKFILEMGNS